jgi:hypothetical protein
MNSLADVELQLVMQGLAVKEILTVARCNKRLLHAASNSFFLEPCCSTADPRRPVGVDRRSPCSSPWIHPHRFELPALTTFTLEAG